MLHFELRAILHSATTAKWQKFPHETSSVQRCLLCTSPIYFPWKIQLFLVLSGVHHEALDMTAMLWSESP
jgi:hypothetical protein